MYNAEEDPTQADSFEILDIQRNRDKDGWDFEALFEFQWEADDSDDSDDPHGFTKQVLFNIENGEVKINHGHEYTHSQKVALKTKFIDGFEA